MRSGAEVAPSSLALSRGSSVPSERQRWFEGLDTERAIFQSFSGHLMNLGRSLFAVSRNETGAVFAAENSRMNYMQSHSNSDRAAAAEYVLVTSTLVDCLNTNTAIRDYVFQAFIDLLGAEHVGCCPLELAQQHIRERKPKLVVAIGSLASDITDLRGLRQSADTSGSLLTYWLHDDPYEFDYAFKAELTADVVFSSDAWSVAHYRHPRVHHLPLAASEHIHYRPLLPTSQRKFSLFFCGVAFPNRIKFLRDIDDTLSRYSVAVVGAGWPNDIRCARNERLSAPEMADCAQQSLFTLNIGRVLDIANRRYALPASTPGPRTFEVALSGSTQLYLVSGLEILDYFDSEKEIILVDSEKDIKIALERARDEPDVIAEIGARSQARALKEHCYVNRVQKILTICDGV